MKSKITKSGFVLSILLATIALSSKAQFFNPLYFRAGLTSGVMSPHSGGFSSSTIGIRTEYGISKIFGVVGDGQVNQGSGNIAGGQATLAMRYTPVTMGRFEPYVSAGLGVGQVLGSSMEGGCSAGPQMATTQVNTTTDVIPPLTDNGTRRTAGLALFTVGANFKLSNHFFANAEAVFQSTMGRHHHGTGATGFKMGLSYQFGGK